jgi:hypothetical protein
MHPDAPPVLQDRQVLSHKEQLAEVVFGKYPEEHMHEFGLEPESSAALG